jgi:hypothetical protein
LANAPIGINFESLTRTSSGLSHLEGQTSGGNDWHRKIKSVSLTGRVSAAIGELPGVSQLATSSAVGYRGNLPGEQHSMGVSYWGAWANGNAPGTTPEFDA